jgi:hypothetical protein
MGFEHTSRDEREGRREEEKELAADERRWTQISRNNLHLR